MDFQCDSCDNDFEILTDSSDDLKYCPFCGDKLDITFERDEEEPEDE